MYSKEGKSIYKKYPSLSLTKNSLVPCTITILPYSLIKYIKKIS